MLRSGQGSARGRGSLRGGGGGGHGQGAGAGGSSMATVMAVSQVRVRARGWWAGSLPCSTQLVLITDCTITMPVYIAFRNADLSSGPSNSAAHIAICMRHSRYSVTCTNMCIAASLLACSVPVVVCPSVRPGHNLSKHEGCRAVWCSPLHIQHTSIRVKWALWLVQDCDVLEGRLLEVLVRVIHDDNI